MKNTLIGIAVCAAAPFADAAGADNASEPRTAQQISRAGSQASVAGPSDYFTGRVRLDPLFPATDEINASGAYVSFEPGARSAWHTHPAGQRLLVTSGVGLVQEWGKPMQEILPGRCDCLPSGRQALAWRRSDERDDALGRDRLGGWQECAMAGESHR